MVMINMFRYINAQSHLLPLTQPPMMPLVTPDETDTFRSESTPSQNSFNNNNATIAPTTVETLAGSILGI